MFLKYLILVFRTNTVIDNDLLLHMPLLPCVHGRGGGISLYINKL